MKATEIAQRIDAHLKRFEADPAINSLSIYGSRLYYRARAWASGGWVCIRYISFHDSDSLRKAAAERYLAWLDAGKVGSHFKALSEALP